MQRIFNPVVFIIPVSEDTYRGEKLKLNQHQKQTNHETNEATSGLYFYFWNRWVYSC